jgi:hypothetical protein
MNWPWFVCLFVRRYIFFNKNLLIIYVNIFRQSLRIGVPKKFFFDFSNKLFSRVKSRVEHESDLHLAILYHIHQDIPTFTKKMPTLNNMFFSLKLRESTNKMDPFQLIEHINTSENAIQFLRDWYSLVFCLKKHFLHNF